MSNVSGLLGGSSGEDFATESYVSVRMLCKGETKDVENASVNFGSDHI
jgi:hypothetical protein